MRVPALILPLALAATSLPAVAQFHDWTEFRQHVTRQIMERNEGMTYSGDPPAVLMSIPVLEVELEADGSVRSVAVIRLPQNVPETAQASVDAVMRAAPFGDVSQLPRPWRFTETFLYDWAGRFVLRSGR
jgi:hypothetical protein